MEKKNSFFPCEEMLLQQALEESAREAGLRVGTHASAILHSSYTSTRAEFLKYKTKHTRNDIKSGIIMQVNIVNQFHRLFFPSIREFQTASSICGYLSLALIKSIDRCIKCNVNTKFELERLLSHIRSEQFVEEELLTRTREVMKEIREARLTYMKTLPKENSSTVLDSYLKNWVANYEISDCLVKDTSISNRVSFFRFNQWPEYSSATYEEKQRILTEEKQFGGRIDKKTKTNIYGEGDSIYFFETFHPKHKFFVPEKFHSRNALYESGIGASVKDIIAIDESDDDEVQIVGVKKSSEEKEHGKNSTKLFVLDLNGHFCVGLTSLIDGTPHFVAFNSTECNYLLNDAAALAFAATYDAVF